MTVEADDQETALDQVWNAVAASGTDDHIVFLEHAGPPRALAAPRRHAFVVASSPLSLSRALDLIVPQLAEAAGKESS